MADIGTAGLAGKSCEACEGNVQPIPSEAVGHFLTQIPEWRLTANGRRIRREWRVRDFVAGMKFFEAIGNLAEDEGHHPDLHLTEYRQLAVEIWTHAIGGLSENDFILAAKIDRLPVELAQTKVK